MIKDKILFKVSFLFFVFGSFLLVFFLYNSKPKYVPLEEIDKDFLNKRIVTEGKIEGFKNYDEFQIITLKNKSKIEVLSREKLDLNKDFRLIVVGKVNEYKNSFIIYADKIEIKQQAI